MYAFVGQSPSEEGERQARPVVGPAGRMVSHMLRDGGLDRRRGHMTHAVACRPPGGDLKTFEERLSKYNKEKAQEDPNWEPILAPTVACRPRLLNEIKGIKHILAAGSTAYAAVTGQSGSVMEMRGAPLELDLPDLGRVKLTPLLSPNMVQQNQRWRHVLKHDIGRAWRFFHNRMRWRDPAIHYSPSVSFIREFLNRDVPFFSSDIETDAKECLDARIRCIGIGAGEEVIIIGLRSIDGSLRDYFGEDRREVLNLMRQFFADESKIKVGHNFGYYDALVLHSQLGVWPKPVVDTMMLHRLVESELPHNLGYVGSMRTDVYYWKADREGRKKSVESETDRELDKYCAIDVRVTDKVAPGLLESVRLRGQDSLISADHRLQTICAEMHMVGMYIDQEARAKESQKLHERINIFRSRVQSASGCPDLNPGSSHQLRRLLFEDWELEPDLPDKELFTARGDFSTNDNVLRACRLIRTLTPQQRETIDYIRYFRRTQKLIGTYVDKVAYNTDVVPTGWDEDESWLERVERVERGDLRQGITDPNTGRMYPGYNAHVAVSGRLSSSSPINAQNFPYVIKHIVTAAPGHILVGADADQLELRGAASRWNSKLYLDTLAQGYDPHSTATCMAVFGERFERVAGSTAPWPTGFKFNAEAKSLRDLGKRVQYASQYWAMARTVWRVIRETELPDPNAPADEPWRTILPYATLSLREVRKLQRNWAKGARFEPGWEQEVATWKAQGYLTEPVMGRRRDFLDGENRNELVNFPIQGGGAGLMNLAMFRVRDQIKPHQWGVGTGIINQCHDSIVVECPLDGAYQEEYKTPDGKTKKRWVAPKGSIPWRVANIIEEAMNQTHPGFPGVKFTASADIGRTWSEV